MANVACQFEWFKRTKYCSSRKNTAKSATTNEFGGSILVYSQCFKLVGEPAMTVVYHHVDDISDPSDLVSSQDCWLRWFLAFGVDYCVEGASNVWPAGGVSTT